MWLLPLAFAMSNSRLKDSPHFHDKK
ncbi:MAG: hypothetical protein ACI8UX_002470 [Psychromonas sp.]